MQLDPVLASTALSQDWLLTASQLRSAGVHPSTVQRLVASDRWVKVRRGVYLVEPGRVARLLPWVEARALVLTHPGTVVAGTSAARLWQLKHAPDGPPEVAVPPGAALRARTDRRVRQWNLSDHEVTTVRGIRLTTVLRTLADLACTHDRLQVLPVLDAALRSGRVSRVDLLAVRETCAGRPGAAHVADLWALADARAESGLESKVRLRCLDAGLVPDALQLEVRDGTGRLVARADLAFRLRSRGRRGWLLVEADGAEVHSAPQALFKDRRRTNELSALDHVQLRFTSVDTLDAFSIPAAVRAAL